MVSGVVWAVTYGEMRGEDIRILVRAEEKVEEERREAWEHSGGSKFHLSFGISQQDHP